MYSEYLSYLIYYNEKEDEIIGDSITAKQKRLNNWYEACLRLPIS